MNGRKSYRPFLTGWAAATLLMGACGRTAPDVPSPVRTAKIDTVRAVDSRQTSVYPGKVRAGADVHLAFRVAGTLLRMPTTEGVFVRKGAVVAEIDARDYRLQLAATEAEYNQIKATAERVAELYRRGSATKSDYEKAVYGLEQITAKYENHKNQLADTRLTAPFDGYIRRKIHDAGETVGAGMPVVAMTGRGAWQIVVPLPLRDYARRADFERFEALLPTGGGVDTVPLELLELAPQGNATQTCTMVLRAGDNADAGTWVAGMSVEVVLTIRTSSPSLCQIPLSALFERNGAPHVWVFTSADRPPEARPITVAEVRNDGTLTVSAGLRAGERIITAGVRSMKDGTLVRPLPDAGKSNVGGLL
jgi:RND family efflux transporter MFP subunit